MSQHNSDDKDFKLNRFEDLPDEEPQQHEESPFEREFTPEGRHEPIIRDATDIDEAIGETNRSGNSPAQEQLQTESSAEKITAPVAPQMGSDFPAKQNSGNSGASLAIAFAVVAMLIAAGSFWLNFTTEQNSQPPTQKETASDYNTIINDELAKLRERLAIVELEKDELSRKVTRQNRELQQQQRLNKNITSQISSLESKVTTLSSKLSQQTKQLTQAIDVKKPAVEKSVQEAVKKPEPKPVKKVTTKTVTQYELPAPLESLPNDSTSASQGGWVINLVSVYSAAAASKELERLQNKGLNAEVAESSVNGKQVYRIRLGGFSSREAATQQKELLSSKYGIKDAWIHKP